MSTEEIRIWFYLYRLSSESSRPCVFCYKSHIDGKLYPVTGCSNDRVTFTGFNSIPLQMTQLTDYYIVR